MTDLRPESQKKIDEAYLDYPNPGDFPEFDAGKYGITEFKQAIANVEVETVLSSGSVGFGSKIDAATMPTGGSGNLGWLSAIWKLISDRIPALSNGKIPVEVGSLNVSVSNASLEIANDVGNPVPISDAGGSITVDGTFWQATQPVSAASLPLPSGAATSSLQTTGNTSLSSIDTKIPVLGQALATASVPVVLPATQITTLTPPTSVGISGTLPAFTSTPTVNIGTSPNLTFTNTSFTANAGTNLNTSALALESGGNLASINTKLPSNLTVTSTRLLVDGSGVTQPVSAASLPLPTGAATASNQSTGNTSLANIDTKTPALGQALAAASTPVVLPATQITALTPPTSVGISGTLPAFTTTPTFNIGTAPSLTFTNTSFTANAGTNLNTSLLALESGGNLASINTKLPSNLTVSATRLLVDGSGVTQPVSLATLPASPAYTSTATITRAANTTGYTANDVYGGVFELTNIGASGGHIFLNSLSIIFDITALPSGMGTFAVYLYSATPPSAITDNLPYSLSGGDKASVLNPTGIILMASLARGGGSVVAEITNINPLFKLATGSTSLWGYLVTLGAFTPAANSETATIRAGSFSP